MILSSPDDWVAFVRTHNISEIVVSPDERRRGQGGAFPLDELIDCKLIGVPTSDALGFFERELGYIDIDLLKPGWMLFSVGFRYFLRRLLAERLYHNALASLFFLILFPVS